MDSSTVYFTIVIVVLFWIYKILFKNDTLALLGIAHDKPLPIIGNTLSIVTKRENFVEFGDRLYDKFSDKKY